MPQDVQVAPAAEIAAPEIIYEPSKNGELRQGEILSDIVQYLRDPAGGDQLAMIEQQHALVIVASQDCDLLWDHEAHLRAEPRQVNSVLLYEVQPADGALAALAGGDIRKRVKNNKDERYHVLQRVPPALDAAGLGLANLLIDFKRFFALDPDELYRQIAEGGGAARRSCLLPPYREHFQSRAAAYLQRVTLPAPHNLVL